MIVGEVAGVKHLDPRVVLAIERRRGWGTARILSGLRRAEPQPEMGHLNGVKRRIRTGVRERPFEHHRGRRGVLRDRECLDAKAADEALMTVSISVGFDVTLIPSDSERRFRNLDD